ncbi:hypothetical protein FBY35_3980 [Streptomyces sp. SLBN-118]|uniref:BlaI/MecI/CopY family transcriptional regulator n=1 Tax=Streptomyces sp. SLBN-118 TaxID=2768454 RepID=UPI001151F848|nr:BlaI/MecI/CopY family transcriptional regulator [Streptomyces sp. SLBN-118]TQK42558.1 hypothetical protein FBY35_3980 [Streptomyces sp. SLBN-118]
MTVQENTTLKAAYAGKVAADLAENTAEQDRIRAEIGTLQAQLAALENDHALLEGVSAALGDTTGGVPAPRKAAKKTAAVAKEEVAKKPVAKNASAKKTMTAKGGAKAANTGADKGPALTELIHAHLSGQSEPRTAREIAKAVADANPGRNVNDNLVRTTTERLVARGRVDRVKQGSTVYYTARPDAAPAASGPAEEAAAAAS